MARPDAGEPTRFLMVDGLRGLAALCVAVGHLIPNDRWAQFASAFGTTAKPAHLLGAFGVDVFFVLSGFVIAHSLLGRRLDARFCGNFALRRSLRLDPPYFATILLILALNAGSNLLFPQRQLPMPAWGSLAAHAAYAFPFFGYPPLVDVFWTLVLEVQFYLLALGLMAFAQARARAAADPAAAYRRWLLLCFGAAGLLSQASRCQTFPWCSEFWHYFAAGACVRFCHGGILSLRDLVTIGALKLALLAWRPDFGHAVGLGTAAALAAASHTGNLSRWFAARPWQFLGAISYSLYLLHHVVGLRILHLRHRVFSHSPWWDAVCIAAALGGSVLAALAFRRWIELPSIALAHRCKLPPSVEGVAPFAHDPGSPR